MRSAIVILVVTLGIAVGAIAPAQADRVPTDLGHRSIASAVIERGASVAAPQDSHRTGCSGTSHSGPIVRRGLGRRFAADIGIAAQGRLRRALECGARAASNPKARKSS